jgi:hypothetical protein
MSDSAHKPDAAFAQFSPAACAEFPSDNPALHEGAVWLCTWTRAYPRAVRLASTARPTSAARPSELGAGAGLPNDALALPDTVASNDVATLHDAVSNLAVRDADGAALTASAPRCDPISAAIAPCDAGFAEATLLTEGAPNEAELVAESPLKGVAPQNHDDSASDAPAATDGADFSDADGSDADGSDADGSDADEDINLWQPQAPAAVTLAAAAGFPSEDPFVLGLQALVAFGEDVYQAPPTAAAPAQQQIATASNAGESSPTAADVEPLTLEGFLSGVSIAESEAVAPVQPLCTLDLDLEELSPQDTAWQDLVKGLCNFLMAEGCSRAAILLPALLQGEAVNLTRLPRTVIECLLAEGIATSSHDNVTVSPRFRARARSLHRAFGSARLDSETLSGWVAGLVHALLASSQDVAAVREQLAAAVPELATLGKPSRALRSA